MTVTRFILLASTAAMAVVAACADREPARSPGTTETTSSKQMPGESVPGSPASAWTTTGGPASPGSPAMGSVTQLDGGKH